MNPFPTALEGVAIPSNGPVNGGNQASFGQVTGNQGSFEQEQDYSLENSRTGFEAQSNYPQESNQLGYEQQSNYAPENEQFSPMNFGGRESENGMENFGDIRGAMNQNDYQRDSNNYEGNMYGNENQAY